MKKIVKYISLFSAAIMAVGCTTDLEQVVYDSSKAVPAQLEALADSYILDVDSPNDVAITFKWEEPDFGYSASVTNNLEFDLSGKEFSGASILTSINLGGEYAVTHSVLNNAVMKLLDSYAMEYETAKFEFRVVSSISDSAAPLYSDVISSTITPYSGTKEYPSIPLRGDYNGWDYDNSQKLYSENEDGIYSGMVFFDGTAANGWKLCEDSGWASNWGCSSAETSEQSSWTMTAGGDNIAIYALNSYYFTFNYSTLEFTMSKPHSSWGIVGAYNDWGGSADTEMELIKVDNTYYLKAVVEFEAGSEWKIRPDSAWGDDIGCSAVKVDAAYCTDGGNFTIPAAGTYTIRWYFNAVEQVVEILEGDVADESTGGTEEPEPDEPSDLGVGDDDVTDEGYTGPDDSAYTSIALRGDYNGWGFDAAQRLFSAAGDTSFAGMIYLDGKGTNGWKLCTDADWTTSWGLIGDETEEQTPITLLDNSQTNINIYAMNSYYATFDSETLELTLSSPHTSWGIVGAYNSWGGSADTDMTLACRDNVYYLTATLEFEAGSEWKIRPDSAWGDDIGCSAVEVDEDFCTEGGNFTIPEAGTYTIRWYFNSVSPAVRVLKHE